MHSVHLPPTKFSQPTVREMARGIGDGDRSESSKPKSPIKRLVN